MGEILLNPEGNNLGDLKKLGLELLSNPLIRRLIVMFMEVIDPPLAHASQKISQSFIVDEGEGVKFYTYQLSFEKC